MSSAICTFPARATNVGCLVLVAGASILLVGTAAIGAEPTFPRVPPTPPDRAEATFETLHGFRMELIAAEPLVVDPVDMAIDEDGRAYVVEMRDYPYPEEKNAPPKEFPGTVRLLEDEDGDGKFDRASVFADQLAWPTSVCCFRGGVFVAAAPDIWYFKDTDGDRKADVRRKVFTGFSRYNVQAIMNSLRWGLDNKIYGSAAGNGGAIRHAERAGDPLIQLTRRDFRFDPVTEKIEAIAGGERFGACFDDWGNRFLCNIRNPVQHVVLPLEYVQRNPHLVVPSLIHDCAESGDQLRVFRLSPPEPWRLFRAQRWSLEGVNFPRSELIGAGFWTSSSGVCVYRGAAYPEPFRGNVFIGVVAGNLVHRQILVRDGVTFKSRRADENTEFVRSRDNWFRPVNFINAPDGTLHVLDMYRETIEHPWSIPDDIKAQLDLTSGNDRGRIYRLAPPGFTQPKPPRVSQAATAELVSHLENPHGWYRETAQRLLFERQDKSAIEPLRKMLAESQSPQARLHAMYALNELAALSEDDVRAQLHDPSADVVRHALMLAQLRAKSDPHLLASVVARARHTDPAVRMQAAASLGELDQESAVYAGLLYIASRDGDDAWVRAAVLSSAIPVAEELALALARRKDRNAQSIGRAEVVRQLAAIAVARGDAGAAERLLRTVAFREQGESDELASALLAGVGHGLARRKENLAALLPQLGPADRQRIEQFMDTVVTRAGDENLTLSQRLSAVDLLAWFPWAKASPALLASLGPTQPPEVQRASLRILGTFNEGGFARELISCWNQLAPPLRDDAVDILLSRPIWHEALVTALEKGEIPAGQVSIPHRARLTALADKALAERAKLALAAVTLGPRKEILEKYQPALSLKGDGERGKIVYRRECMHCHKLAGEGHDVGPSLETVQHRSPQEILIHVLDPSREVSPQFLDYAVRLRDGRVVTGMIAGETDAGLTLRRAEKQEEAILRSEIEEITSSGKSLMPDGMEQKISLEEMADLITYLRPPTISPQSQAPSPSP
jgi:putative membrane-bound dehydrogenase-like protein